MLRREFLAGSTLILTAGGLDLAWAEFKPTRPVEFVVHGGPGSGNDVFARALVVGRTDSPIKSMDDFFKAAKQRPGALQMSGGSIASRQNSVRQLLMQVTGARWAFISFPSGGERIAALLGGHVDLMIVDPSEAGEQVRAGKLRTIAQVSERRLAGFPDVPTLQEAGFDIPQVPQMRGILGTGSMPAD